MPARGELFATRVCASAGSRYEPVQKNAVSTRISTSDQAAFDVTSMSKALLVVAMEPASGEVGSHRGYRRAMTEVQIFPLVSNVALPRPAPATTRSQIPQGYGVQEQCLPFTAATALGFLIESPITFGLCLPTDVPPDGHAFRSPLDRLRSDGTFEDERVFYVKDNTRCSFAKNAFTLDAFEIVGSQGKRGFAPLEPGISFFDRRDQLDLFKLHLPYIWRTLPEIDTLFLPAINRPTLPLTVLSGLVETDWYANPINLVIRKPPSPYAIHVAVGDPVAQAIFVKRPDRRPTLKVIASHARVARDFRTALAEWYQHRAQDRSAYKILARSHHGQVQMEKLSGPIASVNPSD
jgi:hypothetical protein